MTDAPATEAIDPVCLAFDVTPDRASSCARAWPKKWAN